MCIWRFVQPTSHGSAIIRWVSQSNPVPPFDTYIPKSGMRCMQAQGSEDVYSLNLIFFVSSASLSTFNALGPMPCRLATSASRHWDRSSRQEIPADANARWAGAARFGNGVTGFNAAPSSCWPVSQRALPWIQRRRLPYSPPALHHGRPHFGKQSDL